MSPVAASPETFTAPRVCELAGVSYRQLDYWIRTDLITPSVIAHGSGSRRLFSENDLRLVCLVKSMLEGGIHLQVIRKVLEGLTEVPAEGTYVILQAEVSHESIGKWGGTRMVVNNQSITITTDTDEVLRIISEGTSWVYRV